MSDEEFKPLTRRQQLENMAMIHRDKSEDAFTNWLNGAEWADATPDQTDGVMAQRIRQFHKIEKLEAQLAVAVKALNYIDDLQDRKECHDKVKEALAKVESMK